MSALAFLGGLAIGGLIGLFVGAFMLWQAGEARMAELRHQHDADVARMEWLFRLREESIRRGLTPDLVPSEALLVEKKIKRVS